MNPTGIEQVAMVIVVDERQWHVPYTPEQCEDHGGLKQVESIAQTVGAVAMPGQLFDNWCGYQQKPDGKYTGSEAVALAEGKLRGGIAERRADAAEASFRLGNPLSACPRPFKGSSTVQSPEPHGAVASVAS